MEIGAGIAWIIGGTIAAFVSAFAAAGALRSQTRAVDVSSYLEILERLQQFERRLKALASDGEESRFALLEYANFLEGLAHLYYDGRFGRGTADLCRDTLSNSIAAVELYSDMMDILADSVASPETFKYLRKFRRKRKDSIEERKAIFRSMNT